MTTSLQGLPYENVRVWQFYHGKTWLNAHFSMIIRDHWFKL